MTPFNRALGNVVFNLLSGAFVVAAWLMFGHVAAVFVVGAMIAQRAAIHCWLTQYGLSLR